ncbi:MAG TPA: ArsC/Spx/MgsR family protein [Saprospiraceae bacterium]|nr:ArsC/Spx/MgsR family protein [Saprospiraceae bacterium]
MAKKIYHLPHCGTCKKIISDLNTESCELIDIKSSPINEKILDQWAKLAGSYQALFSKKAIKYKTMGLKDKVLTEADFKKYILSDYTFIKRPVIVVGKKIFIGHAADQILGAQAALNIK